MKRQANQIRFHPIFFVILVFFLLVIAGRLVYISSAKEVDGVDVKKFAAGRNMQKNILYAKRGSILDHKGEELAHNVNAYTVIAYLAESRTTNPKNPQHVVDKEQTALELSKLINMPKENILKLLNKKAYQVELGPGGRDITELTKQKIQALDLPGISFIKGQKREYPNEQFASYILGYVQKDDTGEMTGELGIEKYYDDQLRGIDGYKEFQKDAQGYQIPETYSKEVSAIDGKDIYLTIDTNIQIFLENALNKMVDKYDPSWSVLTIMNAKTGAIVGSATHPTFNPKSKNIKNYNNPLTSYTFEPGSTMKIFSYMAAMENSVYNGEETYKSGTIKVADSTIKDHNGVGWGTITYDKGFPYSSNVAVTLLSKKLGRQRLKDYYLKLGFGKKTNLELSGELDGIINFKYDVEVANAAFGQGITVTPIQMLQAMTPLSNNGILLKPYVIEKIVDPNTKKVTYQHERKELGVVASTKTIEHIKDLMDETVNGDDPKKTAGGFGVEDITVIGKTGTAQIAGKDGKYLTGKNQYVRSFIGMFPKENPEYIIYIAARDFKAISNRLGETIVEIVENISKNEYLTNEIVDKFNQDIYEMPNFMNKNIAQVKNKLNELTNNVIIIGDGEYVIDQYPASGKKIHEKNKVFILTNTKEIKMPNIYGWPSSDLINYCNIIDLKYKMTDYGYVSETSIKENEIINFKDTLIVDLKPK